MRRHCHDDACAVGCQNVVGHPELNFLAIERVYRIQAREHAILVGGFGLAFDLRFCDSFLNVLLNSLLAIRRNFQLLQQVGLGCDCHESHTENRIWPCCEHRNLDIRIGQLELDLAPYRLADPVPLHRLQAIRPAWQLIEALQQPISIFCDLEKPLIETLLDYWIMTTPAGAVGLNLLIRQHGVAGRAEVHQ